MIEADSGYRDLVIDILSSAFDDNQSINYIVKQDTHRKWRIRYLMGYCFDVCQKYGKTFISGDGKACGLVLLPEQKKKTLLKDLQLTIRCIGVRNILKVLKREKLLSAYHPTIPFYYLWFIGVFSRWQNRGIGSDILNEILKCCDENKRPIYLETSVVRNISWYEKFGFHLFNELNIGCKLYQMIRD